MKNPMEVLRVKEQELLKVKNEVAALRITMRLIGEDASSAGVEKAEQKKVLEMQ